MLGAVGAYEWTGTVVQETAKQAAIFPKEAFEKVLQDRNHTSYLGEGSGSKGRVKYFSNVLGYSLSHSCFRTVESHLKIYHSRTFLFIFLDT